MGILYFAICCTIMLTIYETCKATKHKFEEIKRKYEERKAFYAMREAYRCRCHYRI